jgi:nucleotidyltransferase/DNA polymerase involved in DNA repair
MKIDELPGLEVDEIGRLRRAGISSRRQLLRLAREDSRLEALAAETNLPLDQLRRAVNWSELSEIRGVGPATLEQLRQAGIESLGDLAAQQPESLSAALRETTDQPPNLAVIEDWIRQARRHTWQPAGVSSS